MNMKKSTIGIIILAGALVAVTPSCNRKGCTDPTANNYEEKAKKDDGSCTYDALWYTEVVYNGVTYRQLPSHVTSDQTLTADAKWMLSGGTFVDNGVTLTIQAGTTVYAANDGTTPFLAIS